MKKFTYRLIVLFCLAASLGHAQTLLPSGTLIVTINNGAGSPQNFDLTPAIASTSTPGVWSLNTANNANLFSYVDSQGYQQGVTLDSLSLNQDPFLNYSFSLRTNGSPTQFSISFTLPTTTTDLPAGQSVIYSGLGFTASSSPTRPLSFSISPVSQAIQVGTVGGIDTGILLGTSALTVSTAPFGLGQTYINTTGNFNNTVPGGTIVVTDTFTVGASSTGGPIALGVAGNFEIDAVPEPATLSMALIVVALLGVLRLRARTL